MQGFAFAEYLIVFFFPINFDKSLTTLENHFTQTAQSLHGGCSQQVHNFLLFFVIHFFPKILLHFPWKICMFFVFVFRYALLVGHPPFETATLKETYIRITDNRYTIPDWVSTQAKNLITKCLNHEPERRPSLDDVLADEFFSCGYFPNRLSGSCCTSIPRFPSQSHNRINRFVHLYFHSYSQGCGNSMCGSRGSPDPP